MTEEDECVFCGGKGFIELFNYQTEQWYEVVCDDCGGTGVEDDEEGK